MTSPNKISILLFTALIPAIASAGVIQNQAAYSQFDYEKYLILPENNQQEIKKVDNGNAKKKPQSVTPVVTEREGDVVSFHFEPVTSTAPCNNDEVVVGGGYRVTTTDDNFSIRGQEKVGNSWQINFVGQDDPGGTLQALAECLKMVSSP